MVVYMDAIWLLNFLADSLLLWLTSIALKRP
ncbi:MAG: sigma-E processing peptidase SpoIIGA, partial [Heyndrickxia faecalis]